MAGSPLNFDFDFTNLIISGKASGSYEVENDLYSDAKELIVANDGGLPAKMPPPFLEVNPEINGSRAGGSVGGNPISATQSIAPYFFINNIDGWRFRPAEEDGETTLNGNFFPLDADTPFIIPTVGGFTQLVRLVVSPQSIVTTTGVSGLTAVESAILLEIRKLFRNQVITTKDGETVVLPTSPETIIPGGKITILEDDNLTVCFQADLFEDAAGTIPYRGKGVERRERLEPPP